ncbi:MAG: acetyl-CoA carboxylase biotin carboxylase subunit [Planctomycetes bacterium]|nr:acetyl-CoA carboxylase biotin carboxylase subunit [Planctomycetota bacterium]
MSKPPFKRVLIANRGEIAMRVMRTAREMGIETVAVYSDADRNALHARRADIAVHIGPSAPSESYLRGDKILAAAKQVGADCIHPGYGFLSENAAFSDACEKAGVVFVGPSAHAIRLMGDKVEARRAADAAEVPLVPGLKDDVRDDAVLIEKAAEIGYPVMLKAAAGGGGKGIRIVHEEKKLLQAAELARNEARAAFGDDRVYLEKFVTRPRHVEVQIVADQHGNVTAFGERECSVQRRHQKLVEESPCSVVTPELRERMCDAAQRLARAVGYVGAGTIEFLHSEGEFYFLEMNTRLQVEHPITEMRFGVDLVREMFRVAAGETVMECPEPRGHAIEIRINAEDPETYFPSLGSIRRLNMPGGPGVRLDSCLYRGMEVTPYYDSMLAKLVVHAEDRPRAIERAIRALQEMRLVGVATSIPVALRALQSELFRSGDYDTSILEKIDRRPPAEMIDVGMLAAAVGHYLHTEEVAAPSATDGLGPRMPMWKVVDRVERLGRRPL